MKITLECNSWDELVEAVAAMANRINEMDATPVSADTSTPQAAAEVSEPEKKTKKSRSLPTEKKVDEQVSPEAINSDPEYTFDQLFNAAMPVIADNAKAMEQLQDYLNEELKVKSLQDLPTEKYGLFAEYIRGMGAKI